MHARAEHLRPAAAFAILCGLLASAGAVSADPPDLAPDHAPVINPGNFANPTSNPSANPAGKPHPGPITFKPWGKVTSLQGSTVTAARHDRVALAVHGAPSGASIGAMTLTFQAPPALPEPLVAGQTVYLSSDGDTAGVVTFPIKVQSTQTVVGRGSGNGKFKMTTTGMQLSNTGIITGTTQINSEDYINGFDGNVAVGILDANGNDLVPTVQVGCWGVNLRSGRTQVWSATVPASVAAQARSVTLYQFNNSCGSNVAAFLATATAVATAVGPIATAVAAL